MFWHFFWSGYEIGFCSPFVDQYRNPHDYHQDYVEESDLYLKSLHMIRALNGFISSSSPDLPAMYLALVTTMVDQGFLLRQDYELALAWVQDLNSVGYHWPALTKTPFPRFQINMSHIVDGRRTENKPASLTAAAMILSRVQADLPKTFWTSDLHDGTRIDVPSTLMSMGHRVMNMGHKRLGGPYPHIIQKMLQPTNPLSPLLDHLTSHSSTISEPIAREFYEYYKADPDTQQTDAFICMFPASFCELYMPFNKTIIMSPSQRFFLGRCSPEESSRLMRHMHMLVETSVRRPRNFIFGSSRYDVEYIKYFTGIDAPLLSSHSFGYVAQSNEYCGASCQPEILVGPLQLRESEHIPTMNAASDGQWAFAAVKQLYPRFEHQDILHHRAMVLLPYAVHSFGITEVYALGVPIFVPSVSFILALNLLQDKNANDAHYCGSNFVVPPQHPLSAHPYSPEDRSEEAQRYWVQFADFYQWPHITTFDTWSDLAHQLHQANFTDIRARMLNQNQVRDAQIRKVLSDMAEQIETNRAIPQDWASSQVLWASEST